MFLTKRVIMKNIFETRFDNIIYILVYEFQVCRLYIFVKIVCIVVYDFSTGEEETFKNKKLKNLETSRDDIKSECFDKTGYMIFFFTLNVHIKINSLKRFSKY